MQLVKSKVSSTKLTESDREDEKNCRVLTLLPSTRTNYVPFQTIMITMNLQIATTAIKKPTFHVHVDAWGFFGFAPDLATHYRSQITVDKLFECFYAVQKVNLNRLD